MPTHNDTVKEHSGRARFLTETNGLAGSSVAAVQATAQVTAEGPRSLAALQLRNLAERYVHDSHEWRVITEGADTIESLIRQRNEANARAECADEVAEARLSAIKLSRLALGTAG